MTPEIVERPRMLLAGIVGCGKDVSGINISELWHAYEKSEPGIENRIDGSWFELHVGEKLGNGIYTVLAGAQVNRIGEQPTEVSVKVVPAGMYAHFAHCMKNGGFDRAFADIDEWIKNNNVTAKTSACSTTTANSIRITRRASYISTYHWPTSTRLSGAVKATTTESAFRRPGATRFTGRIPCPAATLQTRQQAWTLT